MTITVRREQLSILHYLSLLPLVARQQGFVQAHDS